MEVEIEFNPDLHRRYLLRFLDKMPSMFSKMDTTRVVITFFAIAGLDILNELDSIPEERKKSIIEWVYSLQVINNEEMVSGFQGSTTFNTEENRGKSSPYKWGHIANTYSSLATLLILGDDLSRVDRNAIIKSLKELQLPSGCFTASKEGTEDDMRFVFCAACICYILNDWSGMDIEKTVDFVLKSISYDGGIGQGPQLESHSGSTFCALATLSLSNQLHRLSPAQFKALRYWLLNRLEFGFNGRPHKPSDTCYSFWSGGALKILDAYQFITTDNNRKFVLSTQDRYGGFSKWINTVSDPMHTYFGLAGLSLVGHDDLSPMFCDLNITQRALRHLHSIHEKWKHHGPYKINGLTKVMHDLEKSLCDMLIAIMGADSFPKDDRKPVEQLKATGRNISYVVVHRGFVLNISVQNKL